jgi:hypothetical protein
MKLFFLQNEPFTIRDVAVVDKTKLITDKWNENDWFEGLSLRTVRSVGVCQLHVSLTYRWRQAGMCISVRSCGVSENRRVLCVARHVLGCWRRRRVLMEQQCRRADAVCCRSDARHRGARRRRRYGVFLMHEESRRRKTEKLRSLDPLPVVGREVRGLTRDLNRDRHSGGYDACKVK